MYELLADRKTLSWYWVTCISLSTDPFCKLGFQCGQHLCFNVDSTTSVMAYLMITFGFSRFTCCVYFVTVSIGIGCVMIQSYRVWHCQLYHQISPPRNRHIMTFPSSTRLPSGSTQMSTLMQTCRKIIQIWYVVELFIDSTKWHSLEKDFKHA